MNQKVSNQELDELWNTLTLDQQKYLISKNVITGTEAREMLGITKSRLSKLVQTGKIKPVKRDSNATLFLRLEIENRMKEAENLRDKYLSKAYK